jgi:GNAT superfamily N-acetyltransferase
MNKLAISQTISVRLADKRDITEIARLAGELGYPSTPEQVHERFAAIHMAPHHATFVAVANEETLIGWIHLSEERSISSEPRAEITGLVVDSRFRSLGAGRLLVDRGEEWARHKGLSAMGVRSNVTRERTHLFYARLGYVITKAQKVFRKAL